VLALGAGPLLCEVALATEWYRYTEMITVGSWSVDGETTGFLARPLSERLSSFGTLGQVCRLAEGARSGGSTIGPEASWSAPRGQSRGEVMVLSSVQQCQGVFLGGRSETRHNASPDISGPHT
jgi:hypothetical protein